MSPLQSIPANIRTALYWIGYVAGVLGQGIALIWGAVAAASPDVQMPLGLIIASAVLGLLQTQLNLLAGSNVTPTNVVTTQAPSDATVTTEVNLAADGDDTVSQSHSPSGACWHSPSEPCEAARRDFGDGNPDRY